MKTTTSATANDNALPVTTEVLAGLVRLLADSAARWTVEGWAAHLAPAKHQFHAINSFLKHEGEFGTFGGLLWAAAFVVTVARCNDFGMSADAAAREIAVRRADRAMKAAAA